MGIAKTKEERTGALPAEVIDVATIGRPHGLRGELRLFPSSERPDRLMKLRNVWTVAKDSPKSTACPRRITSLRPAGKTLRVKFDGVDGRDAAAELTHSSVWAKTADLPAWGEDEFGVADIIGHELFDGDELVGTIKGLFAGGGQDCFEVSHDGRQVLVPAVKAWLVKFDREAGRIVMDLPDGLLDDEPPEQPAANGGEA